MDNNIMRWETVDDIIEHWSNENVAIELLRKSRIAEAGSIKNIERYEKDPYHKGLIFHILEKDVFTNQKILIDFKLGEPCIDQVYDAVYGIGKDCHKRIIVFDINFNIKNDENNPSADIHAVHNLISVMNECSLNLQLFYLEEDCSYLFPYGTLYDQLIDTSMTKKPTKEQFRYEEFWVIFFNSLNEGFYDPFEAFNGNFRDTSDWGHMIYVDDFADLTVCWNDSGITYTVKQENDSDDYLKKIWSLKQEEIQKRYGAENVEFEYLPGKLPRILIRYLNKRVEWLMSATSKEKMEFAKMLYEDVWELKDILEDAYIECEKVDLFN